jgi:hypothetical protein
MAQGPERASSRNAGKLPKQGRQTHHHGGVRPFSGVGCSDSGRAVRARRISRRRDPQNVDDAGPDTCTRRLAHHRHPQYAPGAAGSVEMTLNVLEEVKLVQRSHPSLQRLSGCGRGNVEQHFPAPVRLFAPDHDVFRLYRLRFSLLVFARFLIVAKVVREVTGSRDFDLYRRES